jgi:hypothetical protein
MDMQVAIQVAKTSTALETKNIGLFTLVGKEAEMIVRRAGDCGVTLRLIGGLAVQFHCHGLRSAYLREHSDIDVFGLSEQYDDIFTVFHQLGYIPNNEFNAWCGHTRLQFLRGEHQKNVDVFLDKFEMDHTLDFSSRLWLDDLTIPITDLLLTKLQIARFEAKDARDVVAILEDHELGHSDDRETINLDYLGNLCSRDWGLYRSVMDNIDRIREFIGLDAPGIRWSEDLTQKVETIRCSLMATRKGLRWRTRSIIGDKVKWYNEVEVGEGEA